MEIAFDPAKDALNVAKHGISLARAADLEVLAFQEDRRVGYGEIRYRAWGLIDDLTYASPSFNAMAACAPSACDGRMSRR